MEFSNPVLMAAIIVIIISYVAIKKYLKSLIMNLKDKNISKKRKIPKIILWTAPRCVSTAFERAIIEIPNGKIFHEPFSIPYYFGPQRISTRYNEEDCKDCNNVTYESVANELTQSYENDENIDFVFSKDMAYYVTQFKPHYYYSYLLSTILRSGDNGPFYHTFLIRRPDKVIVSLYKASLNKELTGWDSFDPKEIGFKDSYQIYQRCLQLGYKNLVIIDADDLLKNPKKILKLYCNRVGLKYNDSITSWKPGQVEAFKLWDGWHDAVINSSGFKLKTQKEIDEKERKLKEFQENVLPKEVQDEIKKAFVIYDKLFEQRLYC